MLPPLALLAAGVGVLVASPRGVARPAPPPPRREPLSVILTADPGYFSGTPEAAVILEHLQGSRNISDDLSFCASGYEGTLGGRSVAVICTGIGVANAAACAVEVLGRYALPHSHRRTRIQEVLYLGTSGWSAVRGGLLDPDDCGAPGAMAIADPARVHANGDVCVSPLGLNWACGFEKWATNATTECMLPLRTAQDQTSVFSDCNFAGPAALSDRVRAAAQAAPLPAMPAELAELQEQYWEATWGGFGISNGPRPGHAQVRDQCAEASSETFYSGVPGEALCRRFISALSSRATGRKVLPGDVTCAAAMEAAGWMKVLLLHGHGVPFVGLRGNSNYLNVPLTRTAEGAWLRNDSWISADDYDRYHKLGYQYAIQTASEVVLRYFGVR